MFTQENVKKYGPAAAVGFGLGCLTSWAVGKFKFTKVTNINPQIADNTGKAAESVATAPAANNTAAVVVN